jgi:branched-chain amino acid aminotransferase
MYQNGVESEFFRAERIDPNIKKINPALIERISTFIKTENIYDALLVSEGETIMEGSKTNVFFIRDNSVYTAPGSLVLKGITRQKVFELCKNLRFQIEETLIPAMDLQTFDAAFFSGTSPKILPISRIANIRFQPNHEILRLLMHAYEEMIAAYMMKKNRMLHASG